MRIILSYIFSLFLFFPGSLYAKSLLYKVQTNTATVYVLGSIHLAKPSLYPLSKEIQSAFSQSDTLVLELDPTSPASLQSIQQAMLNKGRYPAGKSLQNQLSAKTYKALHTYVDKAGLDIRQFSPLRPWVVTMQLSMMEMTRLGYSPELGIDQHFLQHAKRLGKPIIELESADAQMALLSVDDKAFQDDLLYYTLISMDEMEPLLSKMFSDWKSGNAAGFDEIMTKPLEGNHQLDTIYTRIITERNYAMTKRIESFLRSEGTYFVVVGAGHVVGNEGIVTLLRSKGHTVTQE